MGGNSETVLFEERLRFLEERVSRLEALMLNFAGMVVGAPGELERVTATIETRRRRDLERDLLIIDPDRRMKAIPKIGRLLIGNGPVPHSEIVRAVQGVLNGRQLGALMADLASQGEVRIIKSLPDRGKPTTYYEYIRGRRS